MKKNDAQSDRLSVRNKFSGGAGFLKVPISNRVMRRFELKMEKQANRAAAKKVSGS